MTQLYAGLQRDGKYYNRFQLKEIEGGLRKALNIKEPTLVRLIFNFIRLSITELQDESGNVYKMTPNDYGELIFENNFVIGRAAQKMYSNEIKPIFDEWMECKICSRGSGRYYVNVRESWDELIDKGHIIETYLENSDQHKWSCTLEDGLDIGKGNFKTLNFQFCTNDGMISITDNPENETDIDFDNARMDYELVSIDGMSEKDFNMAKRVAKDGKLLTKFVKSDKDWDIIAESRPAIGINLDGRVVKCDKCRSKIVGGDLKNFFFFLTLNMNQRRSLSKN